MDPEATDTQSPPLALTTTPIQNLTNTYTDTKFTVKLQNLQKTHPQRRITRGDGNCFYRSLGAEYFAQRETKIKEKKCTRDKNKVEKDDDGIEKSELAWSDTLHWKE